MAKHALIKECIKVEKSSASVYKKLMTVFPDKKDFWKELFDDEIDHLAFLNDVTSLGLIDVMQKIGSLPSAEVVNQTLKTVDDIHLKIKEDPITLRKALALVLKLEQSVVETYTNKVIAHLLSCEDEVSYKKLVADEKKHINKIKKLMSK